MISRKEERGHNDNVYALQVFWQGFGLPRLDQTVDGSGEAMLVF